MLPLLLIENLSLAFAQHDAGPATTMALNGITLSVSRGEIVALVGESGSGKTVTSLSILRLLSSPPASYPTGRILFSENGTDAVDLLRCDEHKLRDIRGNRIAMIFQEPMTSLNPVFTCGDQVTEALRSHHRISRAEARKKTIEWFEKVQLPEPAAAYDRYPHQLSGGQKQRVVIAMAMCCEPALLICDEPTTALDVTVQKNILRLIRELQQETGMGVIFITHDLGVVSEIADRTVVMYRGSIVEQNSTSHVFLHPQHPYTKGLLACRPILHRKGERLPVVSDFWNGDEELKTTAVNPVTTERISTPEPGRRPSEVATAVDPAASSVLLSVNQLSVWFPAKRSLFGKVTRYTKAVDDVTFDLFRNETLGLVGESGCGKTTLGRTLLRLIEPTAGTVSYDGRPFGDYTAKETTVLRQQIQLIFQDPYSSLNPRMTIGNAILEPLIYHRFCGSADAARQRVMELLSAVGLLPEHFNRYPHEFSGGQRQRIVIARALALKPSFIVCDESVSALDVSIQAQILNLLNDLRKQFGFTVIFISHDLSVVRYISDRIIVMNKGKIEESGPAEQVWLAPQSAYTRKLIDSIPKGIVPQAQ